MVKNLVNLHRLSWLQDNGDRHCIAGIPTVLQLIPVFIVNVKVIACVPVIGPVSRPRVHHHEPKAAVLETRVTRNYDGLTLDAKRVLCAEIETETILRNVVATIAATLRPGAVIGLPI